MDKPKVKNQLVGKTIKTIDCDCVNQLILKFTDGTSVQIMADDTYCGGGNLPYLEVMDSK